MQDILFFHSKSAPVLPGKGVHERVSRPYPTLSANPHWRRALSNLWVSPFTYIDGYRYNSVEHCFQAQKLAIPYGNSRSSGSFVPFEHCKAFEFTMDSLSPLGVADGAAAQALRKSVLLTTHERFVWEKEKEEVMAQAQFAKFSQNPSLRAVLLATGDAELWHAAARQKPSRMLSLERVRSALRAGLPSLPSVSNDSDSEDES